MQGYKQEYKAQTEGPTTAARSMDAAWFYVLQFNGSARSDRMTEDYREALDRLVIAGQVAAETLTEGVARYSLPAGFMPSEEDAEADANTHGQDEDAEGLIALLAEEEDARSGYGFLATYGNASDF